MKRFSMLIFSAVLLLSFAGCSDNRFMKDKEIKKLDYTIMGRITFSYLDENETTKEYSTKFYLYYDKAPITVTNFVKLVNEKFYDDTYCINYSIAEDKEFLGVDVMQKDDDGQLVAKELDYYIKGEFQSNGWTKNDKNHEFGTMSMVRTNESNKDSAQAAFMICLSNEGYSYRDDNFAVFGKMEIDTSFFDGVLRKFSGSLQNYEFKVKTITITNLDVDLGEPLKIRK
jgi:cyclophilin family peptidyl-prolyl cis-trans isomerase